jgi:hypothetical protein
MLYDKYVASSIELSSLAGQFASISPEMGIVSSAEFMTPDYFTAFTERYINRVKLDKNTTPDGNLEIETSEILGPEETEIPIFLQAYPKLNLRQSQPKWTIRVAMNGIRAEAQTFLRFCVDIQDQVEAVENPDRVTVFSKIDETIRQKARRKEAALQFYKENESLVNATFRRLIEN